MRLALQSNMECMCDAVHVLLHSVQLSVQCSWLRSSHCKIGVTLVFSVFRQTTLCLCLICSPAVNLRCQAWLHCVSLLFKLCVVNWSSTFWSSAETSPSYLPLGWANPLCLLSDNSSEWLQRTPGALGFPSCLSPPPTDTLGHNLHLWLSRLFCVLALMEILCWLYCLTPMSYFTIWFL